MLWIVCFNEEERAVYETRMQSLADVESKIASAKQKGQEEGKREGRIEGKKEGKVEGMAETLLIVLAGRYGELG